MAKQIKKTAKPAKKTVAKPAPVMENKCGKDCPCGCHQHCPGHRLKHIMILIIVFVLGYACGKIFCLCPMHKHMARYSHPVFTNGCLDMQNINNTKFQERLLKADVNEDGCVSVEEYQVFKAKWTDNKGPKKPGMFFNMKHHQMRGPKNVQQ